MSYGYNVNFLRDQVCARPQLIKLVDKFITTHSAFIDAE
jgi:hypothetical protein